jgi:cell division septation protein DedD
MRTRMQDEAFHEIQLNGKQLVFLFMASTVVAVVIFLCGVLVGRGVPDQRAGGATEVAADAAVDPTAGAQPPLDAPRATSSTPENAPLTAGETLTYAERLEEPTPAPETLKAPVEPVPVSEPAPAAAAATALGAPSGPGFVVQVAAVKQRDEADTIARRLSTRGYPAFVTTAPGGVQMFRVRVGKFSDRREAEVTASRLQKEEHFKPWITR